MRNQRGFTLPELLASTAILLIVIVIAAATTVFRGELDVTGPGGLIADANQSLRAATNMMVRDLMQAARGIPIGGVPIPSGAGAAAINRPGPPGSAYQFDNVNYTTLPAIVPGPALGPSVNGQTTDIVTIMMTDPTLPALTLNATPPVTDQPFLSTDGTSLDVGTSTWWITDAAAGVRPGNLILFTNALGSALQSVTATEAMTGVVKFEAGDWFNFNQPGAARGSITQILAAPVPQTIARRVLMVTYYVDTASTPSVPRLARRVNAAPGQALAGAIEDLELSYDLVGGLDNPVAQKSVPVTIGGVLYTPNQIRKINLYVGVRSETVSPKTGRFVRSHLTTAVSVRSPAYVSRDQ
jgi:prepilin-type N-terminal cleavage/methylation domain-containing protein